MKVRAAGAEGWVNQKYLIPIIDTTAHPRARIVGVAPQVLRVHAEPQNNSSTVDRLSEAAEVDLLDTHDSDGIHWQHIQIDTTNGWVDSQYIQPIQ